MCLTMIFVLIQELEFTIGVPAVLEYRCPKIVISSLTTWIQVRKETPVDGGSKSMLLLHRNMAVISIFSFTSLSAMIAQ